MKIVIEDIYSRIYTEDPRALAIARKVCRARPSGFQYSPKYKNGSWDGFITLMHSVSSFPTGLLGYVVPALKAKGYEVELIWKDSRPEKTREIGEDALYSVRLRDYQVEAANALLKAGRGVAKMATNSGKTEVFAAILQVFKTRQALVIVHRKELLHQTAERLQDRLGVAVGKIGDNNFKPRKITVAMIQSLHNLMGGEKLEELFSGNEVLIIDECHHASSNQMMDVLFKIPGKYRYGFSGTPLKEDELADMKLMSATGRVIVEVTNQELIDQGYSAVPRIYLHEIISEDLLYWEMDYHSAYKELIVENKRRNDLISALAREHANQDEVVLILVVQIEHGDLLARKTGGIYSSGQHTSKHRMNMLEDMRKGIPGVYIATTIFDEGVDVPNINTLILAGGGKSGLKLLQRVGRGLRRKPGENVLVVHDFIDDTNKYLLKHSEGRIDVYVDEGFELFAEEATARVVL